MRKSVFSHFGHSRTIVERARAVRIAGRLGHHLYLAAGVIDVDLAHGVPRVGLRRLAALDAHVVHVVDLHVDTEQMNHTQNSFSDSQIGRLDLTILIFLLT